MLLSAEMLREQAEQVGVVLDDEGLAELQLQLADLLAWTEQLPDRPAPDAAPPPWATVQQP